MTSFPYKIQITAFLDFMFEDTSNKIEETINSETDKDKTIAELGGLHEFMNHESNLINHVRYFCRTMKWEEVLSDGELLPEITEYVLGYFPRYEAVGFVLCKRKAVGTIDSYTRGIFIDLLDT